MSDRRIIFVGHDASRTGAPIQLLHLLRWLKADSDSSFHILLNDGGPLEEDYQAMAPTWVMSRELSRPSGWAGRVPLLRRWLRLRRGARLRQTLRAFGPQLIYANTAATRPPLEFLADLDVPTIVHIHELDIAIKEFIGVNNFALVKSRASHYIAASAAVRTNLLTNHRISADAIDVVHEFIATKIGPSGEREGRRRLCEELGLDPGARFIGAAGALEWRKGSDLFVQLALAICRRDPGRSVHFLWLGGQVNGTEARLLRYDVDKAGLGSRVHFLGARSNPLDYIDLFDIFALTSREDPYPLVVLEAASLGKPIVCFEGAGGAPEFVEDDCGFVVPYMDVGAMVDRILVLLDSDELRGRLGDAAQRKVRQRHDLNAVAPRVLEIINRFRRRSP